MPASDERRLEALLLAPVRRVWRRLNALAWAEAGVAPLWAGATGCVLARLLLRDAAAWALPVPLLAAGAWWLLRARARTVPLSHAAVLADRSAGAGGLLLTRLERPVGEWEPAALQYARAVKPPPVAWRRPTGALVAALAFLGVGFLLPLPAPRARPANAAAAAKVAEVRAQAEVLAREEPLGESLEEELRRLAEEVAEGRFDAADWESVDGLAKSLEARAARAAAELAAAAEAARELEESLDAAHGAEAAAREREALSLALLALGHDTSSSPPQGAPGEGSREGPEGTRRTPETRDEVAELRETLERRRQALEQRFGEPGQGRRQGEGRGRGQGQGHASRQVRPGSEAGQEAGAGRGGESQPLVFGERAEMDPERLAFQPLPEGQGGEAQGLWGLRAAQPERREGAPGADGQGTRARGEATAGHAGAPLLPRNRELVRRYFGGDSE